MRNFVWGAVCGALVMYLYVLGLDEIHRRIADAWAEVSSPPASARRTTP